MQLKKTAKCSEKLKYRLLGHIHHQIVHEAVTNDVIVCIIVRVEKTVAAIMDGLMVTPRLISFCCNTSPVGAGNSDEDEDNAVI
jgi:hypothetical protein